MKWTPEYQEAALSLYKEFDQVLPDANDSRVREVAESIGITSATLAYKLANYRFLDPVAEERGKGGLAGISKLDVRHWVEGGNRLSRRAIKRLEEKGWLEGLGLVNDSGLLFTSRHYDLESGKELLRNLNSKREMASLVCSVITKPFVILTGASGTGKTKVAESLAKQLTNENRENYAVVAVGSDWTDSRNVLGYVNHLREGEDGLPIYQSTQVLDLLLEANLPKNQKTPFFLILDEMNLSHVERYLADFLSAMERSEGELVLHQEGVKGTNLQRFLGQPGDVPRSVPYPQNLFVIGTVNIDETTYMFSPKVLDRANVIEFAVTEDEMTIRVNLGVRSKCLQGGGVLCGFR
ncbi:McrB family protein, partial [Roseibacillus ishigakijimensis]